MKATNRLIDYLLDKAEQGESGMRNAMHTNQQLRSAIETLQSELKDVKSREPDEELQERVHAMSINKHVKVFMAPEVEGGLRYPCSILAVRSSGGVSEITIQHVKV